MKDSQTKQIKEFYDENAEYQRNDRYSDTSQSVFTKPDDKYHWLVMKPKGADAVEVHLTDEQGVITARDNYQSQRNTIKCTSMERLSNDKKMIPFSEDEINILYQFGEGGKDGTLAIMNQILPRICDEATKGIVKDVIDKIDRIAPEICSKLISSVKCRKISERDSSIRERLAKAQKKVKAPINNGEKKDRRKEQSL